MPPVTIQQRFAEGSLSCCSLPGRGERPVTTRQANGSDAALVGPIRSGGRISAMLRSTGSRPSLRERFHSLAHRWTMHVGVAWNDLFGSAEDSNTRRRKNKAWLDIEPLEKRE